MQNQGQKRTPVVVYRETRDKGGLQWRVTGQPVTMASPGGGLMQNQGQRRTPVVGYRETGDYGGQQWRVIVGKKAVNCMNSRTAIRVAAAFSNFYRYTAVIIIIIIIIIIFINCNWVVTRWQWLLYHYCYYHNYHSYLRVKTFFKNLEGTSKFKPPEGWHHPSSVLRAHKR
jgi:hypothetical protein